MHHQSDGPSPGGGANFANILEITEDGVVAIDTYQRIVMFNQGAERIFGHASDELLGTPFDLLIPERFVLNHRSHVADFAKSSVQARLMGERREVIGLRKDGSEFPAEVSICKFDQAGATYFAAIVRDITERKRSEAAMVQINHQLENRVSTRTQELEFANEQLQSSLRQLESKTDELRSTSQQLWQAAKLASVGELAASIAHELNNPLGTVSLRVESILAQTGLDDPRRRSLEIVEQEVERMARLVANLLQFSRHGREQISTVNVDEEIRMTAELTQHFLKRRSIEISTHFEEGLPTIFADRQKLRQVFLNLFTNAGDAMPHGGKLVTRVRKDLSPAGKSQLVVEVSDTGVGISPEILHRVTDPFFTTKEEGKGTGLGLAICKRIVHEHQGSIHIESEVGKGTCIRITLPVASEKNVRKLVDS
ncbi:MAG: PAS domain S-box protein [Planctomycetes bacterium]|nr:PAS domain S-box protein [Planctomycetota bacterium]